MSKTNDEKMPLTPEQERAFAESAALATQSSKTMDRIIEILQEAEKAFPKDFDMSTFLLLQHVGKNAMGDMQIRDFVTGLNFYDLPKFRNTILNYYKFQYIFVFKSLGANFGDGLYGDKGYVEIKGLDEIAEKFVEFNKLTDDSPYKMPEIQSEKKDLWDKIHSFIARGKKLRLSKQ